MKYILTIVGICLLMVGCAMKTVRQQDLVAWQDVPVEALDTHSIFLTMPMVKTVTDSGIEIRNYVNKKNTSSCYGRATGNSRGSINGYSKNYASTMSSSQYSTFSNCSSQIIGCDNIFYIKNGKVIEYAPTGQCFTDERAQPQPRYKRFISK